MGTNLIDENRSLQFSQKSMTLIRELFFPKSNEEVINMFTDNFDISKMKAIKVIDLLVKYGILMQGNFSMRDQTALYSSIYSDPNNQKIMLLDWIRTNTYKDAINEVIKVGDTVIDVGAGSGILSLFSASAGASKVYAIEVTEIINVAKQLAVINNLSDKIEFLNDSAQTVNLDQQVDLIVSEWMGMFAIEEYMFDAVQCIRDRFLKPGGNMIPNAVKLFIAPIENRDLYYKKGSGFWKSKFFGYDFNLDLQQNTTIEKSKRCIIPPESLIGSPELLLNFNCMQDTSSAFHFTKEVEWQMERDAFLHGFCGYFDTILTDKITLSTSPMVSATHWQQVYFPIDEIFVKRADKLHLVITTKSGHRSPLVFLEGDLFRDGKIISSFKSKCFDGTLVAG